MTWWNNDWDYRKEITITNKADEYQSFIKIAYDTSGPTDCDVDCNGHCNGDFSDIRFVSGDDDETVPYWVEYKVDSDFAIVWVNNKWNDSTLYMYYGNSDAVSSSSMDDTWDWSIDWSTDKTSLFTKYSSSSPEGFAYLTNTGAGISSVSGFKVLAPIAIHYVSYNKYDVYVGMLFNSIADDHRDSDSLVEFRHNVDSDWSPEDYGVLIATKDNNAGSSSWDSHQFFPTTGIYYTHCFVCTSTSINLSIRESHSAGTIKTSIQHTTDISDDTLDYVGYNADIATQGTPDDYWEYDETDKSIIWGTHKSNRSTLKLMNKYIVIGKYKDDEPSLSFGNEEEISGEGELFIKNLSDSVAINEQLTKDVEAIKYESINISDLIFEKDIDLNKKDTEALYDDLKRIVEYTRLIQELENVDDSFKRIVEYTRESDDLIQLSDIIKKQPYKTIYEQLSVSDYFEKDIGLNKNDTEALLDDFKRIVEYTRESDDLIQLSDIIKKQPYKTIYEQLSVSDYFEKICEYNRLIQELEELDDSSRNLRYNPPENYLASLREIIKLSDKIKIQIKSKFFVISNDTEYIRLLKPEIGGEQSNIDFSDTKITFADDSFYVGINELQDDTIEINGYDIILDETLDKYNFITDSMTEKKVIRITGLSEDIDGEYVINSFRYGTVLGTTNYFKYSLNLKRKRSD